MTVFVQRRLGSIDGYGQGQKILTYEYDRAYRPGIGGSTVLCVDWIGGDDATQHDQFREFPMHSIDEILFDGVEVVTYQAMLEDLGAAVDQMSLDMMEQTVEKLK